jgi:hypothetical protein
MLTPYVKGTLIPYTDTRPLLPPSGELLVHFLPYQPDYLVLGKICAIRVELDFIVFLHVPIRLKVEQPCLAENSFSTFTVCGRLTGRHLPPPKEELFSVLRCLVCQPG